MPQLHYDAAWPSALLLMCWWAHWTACLYCPRVIVVSAVSVWCSCFAVWIAISLAPSLIWSGKVSDMLSAIWTARLTVMASVAPSWIIDSMSWGKCLFFLCKLELRLPNTRVVSALMSLTLSAIVVDPCILTMQVGLSWCCHWCHTMLVWHQCVSDQWWHTVWHQVKCAHIIR